MIELSFYVVALAIPFAVAGAFIGAVEFASRLPAFAIRIESAACRFRANRVALQRAAAVSAMVRKQEAREALGY